MDFVDSLFRKSFIIRWIIGILFLFGVFNNVGNGFALNSIFFVFACLLIPPIESYFSQKLQISKPVKIGISIFLSILTLSLFPNLKTIDSKPSETKTENIPEVTVPSQPTLTPSEISTPSAMVNPDRQLVSVVEVIDGDTINVSSDGQKYTLRLIGVDTPETVDPRKAVQCFGKEASAYTKLQLEGKEVWLERDDSQGDQDKYNRLLRYVFLKDETNFNKSLIRDGYAHEYTYNKPYKYQTEFKLAQKEAQENKRGLWGDGVCNLSNSDSSIPQDSTIIAPTTIPSVSNNSNSVVPTKVIIPSNNGSFTCGGKTKCGEMATCEEAKFYLNSCGVSRLDADKDGIPCESLCN